MRIALPLAVVAAIVSCPVAADVFKCQVGGRSVYQQAPCAPGTAKGTIAARPGVSDSEARLARTKFEQGEAARTTSERLRVIDREIDEKTTSIEQFQRAMDEELDALRAKKGSARNNLAGATWEQSISTEMEAVASKYRTKIKLAQDEIESLRREKDTLKK